MIEEAMYELCSSISLLMQQQVHLLTVEPTGVRRDKKYVDIVITHYIM